MRRSVRSGLSVFLMVLLTAALVSMSGCSRSDYKIRFGTAGMGGNYYTFGQAFSQILTNENDRFEIDVKETAGSAANLRLLSEGYIQVAVAQTDMIDEAVNSAGLSGFLAVAGLYTETCQIVVRADSGIRSLRDLKGKNVNIGEEESGTERNATQILEAVGLSDKLIHASSLSYTEAVSAMESGELDAMFVTAGIQTTILETLAKDTPVQFLPIDDGTISLLTDTYQSYSRTVIPAGTYTGQNEAVATVGVKSVLVVSDKLGEAVVAEMTKALFDHASDLQHVVPADLDLSEGNAVSGIPIAFHPGALSYYAEAGISLE